MKIVVTKFHLYKALAIGFAFIALLLFYISTRQTNYRLYPWESDVQEYFAENDSLLNNLQRRELGVLNDSIRIWYLQQQALKDEVRKDIARETPDYNGIVASIALILGSLVSVFKLISDKNHKDLVGQIEEHHDVNVKQHEQIFAVLTIVEDITVRKGVNDSLRMIAKNHIHYNKVILPEALCILISSQADRLIELTDTILTERFTMASMDLAEVKIVELSEQAYKQVVEFVGVEFLPTYKLLLASSLNRFKGDLAELVQCGIVNSKYQRYQAAAELFLHNLISATIKEYLKFKQHHK